MKKIIDLVKKIFDRIMEIVVTIIGGGICAILPAIIMYGGNQTSISRIKKFGEESPEGIEAAKIANVINIVCGIILGIIAIGVIIAIIKVLFGKSKLLDDSSDIHSYGTYDYDINTNNSSNNNQNKKSSFDFDIKTSYVTDNFGNVVGKVQTTSYGDKYGGFEKKEILDNFGNKQGEVDTYKW